MLPSKEKFASEQATTTRSLPPNRGGFLRLTRNVDGSRLWTVQLAPKHPLLATGVTRSASVWKR